MTPIQYFLDLAIMGAYPQSSNGEKRANELYRAFTDCIGSLDSRAQAGFLAFVESRLAVPQVDQETGKITDGLFAGKTISEVLADRDDFNRIVNG